MNVTMWPPKPPCLTLSAVSLYNLFFVLQHPHQQCLLLSCNNVIHGTLLIYFPPFKKLSNRPDSKIWPSTSLPVSLPCDAQNETIQLPKDLNIPFGFNKLTSTSLNTVGTL